MRALHRHERYIVTSATSSRALHRHERCECYEHCGTTVSHATHRRKLRIVSNRTSLCAARCRKHPTIAGISSWQAEHPSKQHRYRLTLLCAKLISSPLPVRHHLGEKCFKAGAMISNEQMAHFMHHHIFQTFRRIQRQTSIDANFSR